MARDESYQSRKEYIRQWARKRYKREREAGICTYCHKPWKGLRSYCDECANRTLEKRKAKHKEDREKRKKGGLCPRCGYAKHPEADAGKAVCFGCRANSALHKGYLI